MNDDELLDALTRSLRAPDAAPSPAELSAFHDALVGGVRAGSVVPFRRRSALGRPALASAAAVLLIAAGGWALAANHQTRPAPVKVLATSEAHLRDALTSGDRSAIAAAATEVRNNLARLDDEDRRNVGSAATQLLAEADEPGEANEGPAVGDRPTDARGSGSGGTTGGSSATTTATTIEGHDGGDDHGGGDGHGGTVTTAPGPASTTSTSIDDHRGGGGDDGSEHGGSGRGGPGPG